MHRHEERIQDLVSHLQTLAEREKAVLARELHDELGGLLVAASMDVAWLDRHLSRPGSAAAPSGAPTTVTTAYSELRRHVDRLRDTLAGAVDVKRRIIEELRPTLLDNVGLFAALRWLVDTSCAPGRRACTVTFPPLEPHLVPDASIAVFRIAQEGLALLMHLPWVVHLNLKLSYADHILAVAVSGMGEPGTASAPATADAEEDSYEIASIRHRSTALGGSVTFSHAAGKAVLRAWIPIENRSTC
jgi:signal transduction histidine kinase